MTAALEFRYNLALPLDARACLSQDLLYRGEAPQRRLALNRGHSIASRALVVPAAP